LTAQLMYDARVQLGSSAASQIELVAVNANPTATSINDVQSWSINHGMLHQWVFLTGAAQQLQSVYHMYNVYVQVNSNELVEHDPILFIIDAKGHERLYFETLDSTSQLDVKSQEIGLEAGMRQWLPQQQ
jgi:cytochrome oxidase Cu insertion factor (SCO1/SenC/PrrC family)